MMERRPKYTAQVCLQTYPASSVHLAIAGHIIPLLSANRYTEITHRGEVDQVLWPTSGHMIAILENQARVRFTYNLLLQSRLAILLHPLYSHANQQAVKAASKWPVSTSRQRKAYGSTRSVT